ncbi:IclR family transcriptional regulator [Cupriavidus basilensis OR16]|uniref:IclR family transcriptional regulator n=1 Tax=Cupriavidus basilensis OR16 TaxID=1127483 RepID=H1S610_9BURK|nr:IclR family transcriptional regulator [Cupriavidus basilensis]EHP42053.1 IclR family transcriptional regulator [Cupriavidus basilensis OR16]
MEPIKSTPAMEQTLISGLACTEELSSDRQFATNLARGVEVLRAFTPVRPILGNQDLVVSTGLPKATVSRLTYTLCLLGFLSRVPGTQKYRLGAGVLALAYPMLAGLAIRQVARPYMEAIARETGCTVNLGMRDRLAVVYVDSCRLDPTNVYQPDIGSTRPVLSSSIGRALLLGSSAEERTAVLNRLRVDDPERFKLEKPMWTRDQQHFNARGFCVSRGEWRPEIHAIAAPVRQNAQQEPFALNCTVAALRDKDGFLERDVAPKLLEAVRQIELGLMR